MSGGSCNYVCYKIEEELCGRMEDPELNDLMKDIVELAHSLEWYLSCDTSRDSYIENVKRFKEKWFKAVRNERLKSYIDKDLSDTRDKLYTLIGVKEDENKEKEGE